MDAFLQECPELSDADRRAFLYADQPAADNNPEGAQQAEEFWARTLASAAALGLLGDSRVQLLDPTGLATLFTFRGDTPSAMPQLLARLMALGHLQPASTYCVPYTSPLQVGRALLLRAARLVGVDLAKDEPLVFTRLAERVAQRIVDCQQAGDTGEALTGCLMSVAEFRRRFAGCVGAKVVAPADAEVLLRLLVSQRRVCVAPAGDPADADHDADPDSHLVKFASSTALLSGRQARPVVTQVDLAAFRLLRVQTELQAQVDALERRSSELLAQARQALQPAAAAARKTDKDDDGGKERARGLLRLHRHVERTLLPARQSSLMAVESALDRLRQSSTDQAVLAALTQASGALRQINAQAGEERVERLVGEWAEAREDADIVGAALGEAAADIAALGAAEGEAEEGELERELEEMLREEQGGDGLAEALRNVDISGEPEHEPEHEPEPVQLPAALPEQDANEDTDADADAVTQQPPDAEHESHSDSDHREAASRSRERIAVPAE